MLIYIAVTQSNRYYQEDFLRLKIVDLFHNWSNIQSNTFFLTFNSINIYIEYHNSILIIYNINPQIHSRQFIDWIEYQGHIQSM